MKLAIKLQDKVKLYSSKLDFEDLSVFIQREFRIRKGQFTLNYIDEEGDQISVSATTDLLMMSSLYEDKKIVKINLKLIEGAQIEEEKVEEKKTQPISISKDNEERKEAQVEVKKEQEQTQFKHHHGHKHGHGHGHGHGHHRHHGRHHKQGLKESNENGPSSSSQQERCSGKARMIEQMFNEYIVKQVDERVKNLLPGIAAQIKDPSIKLFSVPNDIVHENTTCSTCFAAPITGILYKCLTCPAYTICENCQAKVDHDHNLLKVKKPSVELKEESPSPFKFLRRMFGKHHRHGHSRSRSHGRQFRCGPGGFFEMKKCYKLSHIYGGEPESYSEFVKKYPELKGKQIALKYAAENKIEEKQAWQRIVDFKTNKIAKMFDKKPEEVREFVEKNKDLRPRQIKHLLIEQGYEAKCKGQFWREMFSKKNEQKVEEKEVKKSEEKIQVKKSEEKKTELKKSISKEKRLRKSQEKTEIVEKSQTLKTLIDLFGKENIKEYIKLIRENRQESEQTIVALWLERK